MRTPHVLDVALFVGALWTWAISAAYFWSIADSRAAILPYVPAALWVGPGELWRLAPVLFLAVLAAIPLLITRARARLRQFRGVLIAVLSVVVTVALVWGGALLSAT